MNTLKVRNLNAHRALKEIEIEASTSSNYNKLLNKVEKVTGTHPEFDKAYVLQGEIFLSLNRFSDALKAFDKAITANPRNTRALASKAQIYDITNANELALEYINLALKYTDSNDTEFLASLFDQKLDILNKINDKSSIISTLVEAQRLLPHKDYGYLNSFYEQEKPRLIAL